METLKSKLKVVWAVAAAVVVAVLVADSTFAVGTPWYYGYKKRDCKGTAYLITTDLGTIHRDAVAKVLASYNSNQNPGDCLNMSRASG